MTVYTENSKSEVKAFVLPRWILGLIVDGYENTVQNAMNNLKHIFFCSKKARSKGFPTAFAIFHEAHLTFSGDT